jgi:hypothetical protein
MSALRFAWTTQGVTQAVGASSPEISAVAPEGVVAIEIFSVVPRVTDAQPTHGSAIAAAKSSLIIGFPPAPTYAYTQPASEIKETLATMLTGRNCWLFRRFHPVPPRLRFQPSPSQPSLFKLIHGIVRGTDSPPALYAQNMKKYA